MTELLVAAAGPECHLLGRVEVLQIQRPHLNITEILFTGALNNDSTTTISTVNSRYLDLGYLE